MNTREKEALKKVINYAIGDEQDHYEECEFNGESTTGHIYLSLKILQDYLDKEKKCQKKK